MPEYRCANIPGSSVFVTLITYQRDKLFSVPENIDRLGQAWETGLRGIERRMWASSLGHSRLILTLVWEDLQIFRNNYLIENS